MFTTTRFDSWDLPEHILNGLNIIGWEFATQVQKDTVPLARSGRDVIGQARTGSGKTAAFGLPILERCQPTGALQALILTPTRELANQVAEEVNMLQGESGLTILTVYGGTDIEKQAKTLGGGVDIIVGTPGRVMDMTERGHIDLSNPALLCLDEADRMLDMGFFPDIMWVVERMKGREQTLLFSATFPQEIIDAAHEFMNDPEFVLTNAEELDIPPIDLFSVHIGRSNKLWVLGRLLARMDDVDQTIVFCNTKRMVDLAVERLKKHRFDVVGLHGDLNQNQREKILTRFREGEVKTIVATDVAARGIDVDAISLVVNYDLPVDMDSFVHRIGRTGRIGRSGEAWSLVSRDDAPQLSRIMATYGLDIVPSEAPELPEGMERDPVRKQDDFGESADVFGYVTVKLDLSPKDAGSAHKVSSWFVEQLNCDELAVGEVRFSDAHTYVSLHTSKIGLAMKAMQKRPYGENTISASIEE
ncbi:MAG: ATP-dependent RNA helicase [Euryarchaeota archaeon]|nr:ATP-dependent RNA helicase [Euryarchaeota archaeon]|tara:strand:+ start:2601 stop:4022 length:1422 start_codon:yes stop_codon:yes gene_type:complete